MGEHTTNGRSHTFAVCTYGESPYLAECIESLKRQSVQSNIIIATSTPNTMIRAIAEENDIPLFVNDAKKGIAADWNFALDMADSPLVTIAHQDDYYCEAYAEHAISMLSGSEKPLIFFSDYGELRNGEFVTDTKLLNTKRKMLKPLQNGKNAGSRFTRRRILSFGSAISCPAVTYAKDNLPQPYFKSGYRTNLDWDAWERFSRLDGEFLFDPEVLMYHRIHADSETSAAIEGHERQDEDREMFERFWPAPIAHAINRFYSKSIESNSL